MVDNYAVRCILCPLQVDCPAEIRPYTEMCVGLLQIEIKKLERARTRTFKLPESWACEEKPE